MLSRPLSAVSPSLLSPHLFRHDVAGGDRQKIRLQDKDVLPVTTVAVAVAVVVVVAIVVVVVVAVLVAIVVVVQAPETLEDPPWESEICAGNS